MAQKEIISPDVHNYVREHYGQIAANHQTELKASCCGGVSSDQECLPSTSNLLQIYEDAEAFDLPDAVANLSLGCGDPVTLAALQPGQTVLDLGSGGGIDCFLAARKVGPQGKVIGVDMTPAMIDQARANQKLMGGENIEFRLGEIEHLPVADGIVDVIISNCVINLSPDKPQVFREAYRVLKPGGKLAVSDIVTQGSLPEEIKSSLSSWAGCVAGALDVSDYTNAIKAAGFTQVSLKPIYFSKEMVDQALEEYGEEIDLGTVPEDALYQTIFSAKITATKPGD